MNKILFLAGPTAVGKTEVSYKLALRLEGEVISADSMQIYRGMDIGTSKPPKEFQEKIPHHLIDIVEPTENFDAVQYRARALQTIEDVLARGHQPIVVGGSGFYIKVLLDGVFKGPSADKRLRKALYQQAAQEGTEPLYQRLKEVDPPSASLVHPNDLRRVVRALEVYYQSGQPISALKPNRQPLCDQYEIHMVGLNRTRAALYQRIDQRVDRMLTEGLIKECRHLMNLPLSQTARQALGYKELFEYLQGNISLEEAIQLLKRNSRRYAKRQLTWFRHEPRLEWIVIENQDSIQTIVEEVIDRFTV